MSRLVVTGGSGFIGTNLMQQGLNAGHEMLDLDIEPPQEPAHAPFFKQIDLRDEAALVKAIKAFKPDGILHLGARADIDGKTLEEYSANTVGTHNVIVAAKRAHVARVVFTSSQLATRMGYVPKHEEDYCPPNAYGESKMIGEKMVRSEAVDAFEWVIVRPTSIWGPWFKMPYRAFFQSVRKGHYMRPRGRKLLKHYGFVGNTAHQFLQLASCPVEKIHGRTLYMADYEPLELGAWTEMVRRGWGVRKVREVPVGVLKTLAVAGDGMKKLGIRNPPLTTYRLGNLLRPLVHDLQPLHEACGELPFTLQQGVDLTIEWMNSHNV